MEFDKSIFQIPFTLQYKSQLLKNEVEHIYIKNYTKQNKSIIKMK